VKKYLLFHHESFQMKKILLLVVGLCVTQFMMAQITDIAEVRAYAAGATPIDDPDIFNLASYDVTYTITGIALNGPEFGRIRYIQDATGSLAVYDAAALDDVQRGDSIIVTGPLIEFASLLEISGLDDFELVSTGNTLPEPQVITLLEFEESNESRLVKVENVSFAVEGSFEGNTNYALVDDSGEFRDLRISNTTDLIGTPIPDVPLSVVGLLGQYQDNYQLLVRDIMDFEFSGPPGFSTAINTEATANDMTVSFNTSGVGNTSVSYGLTEELELGTVSEEALTNEHTISIDGLEPGQIYFIQVSSTSGTGETSTSDIIAVVTTSLSSGNIDVYFNRSVNNDYATFEDAVRLPQTFDDTLKAYIAKAESTLDIAIYNVDNDLGMVDAINAVAASGVTVRVVANEGMNAAAFNGLNVAQKIKSPGGQDYGLMHNKFVIIDAESTDPNVPYVITGSTNWTDVQLEFDANNLVIIQDQALARVYQLEFEEMIGGKFSNDKSNNTPKKLVVGGKQVEVYFSPTDDTNNVLQETIETADSELYFAILEFTRNDLAYAITDEVEEGVFVAGVMNNVSDDNASPYGIMTDFSDNVVEDNTDYQVHHKYMIIDQCDLDSDPLVLTGSHNWSTNAQARSDENILIIHDANIANQFYQEWVERYNQALGTELLACSELGVGVSSINEINPLKAYPNPVQNDLYLELSSEETNKAINLQVVDVTGRIVLEKNFELLNGQNLYRVDVTSLNNGVYVLKIDNRNTKFVVNK